MTTFLTAEERAKPYCFGFIEALETIKFSCERTDLAAGIKVEGAGTPEEYSRAVSAFICDFTQFTLPKLNAFSGWLPIKWDLTGFRFHVDGAFIQIK